MPVPADAALYTARKFAWSNGSAAPWWAERAEVVNNHSGRRSGRLRAPIPPAGRRIPRPERTLTSTRTYEKSEFNDRSLTLRAGPRFLFETFDLRPELTARARRLGGEMYSRAAGIEFSGYWQVAPAWRLSAAVGGERISYETFLGEGNMYSAQVGLAHALGRATLLRADGAFRREAVESEAYSWREAIVGASATRELPRGFVMTVGSTYRFRRYDRPLAAFGPEARQDRTLAGRMKISNRHIELFGFMPELTVKHERRSSNLSLHDYKRNLVEVGVVRTF